MRYWSQYRNIQYILYTHFTDTLYIFNNMQVLFISIPIMKLVLLYCKTGNCQTISIASSAWNDKIKKVAANFAVRIRFRTSFWILYFILDGAKMPQPKWRCKHFLVRTLLVRHIVHFLFPIFLFQISLTRWGGPCQLWVTFECSGALLVSHFLVKYERLV